jgi:hypothetical protein
MPTELIESNPYSLAIISVHTVRQTGYNTSTTNGRQSIEDFLPSSGDMTVCSLVYITYE